MSTLDSEAIKEQYAEICSELSKMGDIAGEFTPEQVERFDELERKKGELEPRYETVIRKDRIGKPKSAPQVIRQDLKPHSITKQDMRLAFKGWALNKVGASVSRNMQEAAERVGFELNRSSWEYKMSIDAVDLDSFELTRAQSQDASSGAEGGYLSSSDMFLGLENKLKAYGGVSSVATIRKVPNGLPGHYATSDKTGRLITWQATENLPIANTSITYSTKTFNIHDAWTATFPVSLKLLQDAEYPVEQDITDAFGEAFGRGYNLAFTTGSGSGRPFGFVTECEGVTIAPGLTTLTMANVDTMLYALDPAYRANAVVMGHDTTFAYLDSLTDTTGRKLTWNSGSSLASAAPRVIGGYRFVTNQDMDAYVSGSTGGTKRVLAVGDFSRYKIRIAREIEIMVLRESLLQPHGAIGFIGYGRVGGRLIQPAAIKFMQVP